MRRSERESRIQAVANTLFGGARDILSVGAGTASFEPNANWGVSRRYDAALWRLSSDTSAVRAGLVIVRGALAPGAVLLLVAPMRAPVLQQLRGLLLREPAPRAELEPLCAAVLLAGFLAPRVHAEVPGWLLVSAQLSAQADELDAFFEQPGRVPSR